MKKLAWFPCKEEVYVVEQLAKTQKRLFPDAADIGLWIEDENAPWLVKFRNSWKEILGCYPQKVERHGDQVTTKIFAPIENDEGRISGEIVSVTRGKYRGRSFISITIGRARVTPAEANRMFGTRLASDSVLKVAARYEIRVRSSF